MIETLDPIAAAGRLPPIGLRVSMGPTDYGHVAYFTTDGGTTAFPPDGKLRTTKLLTVEFVRDAPVR